MSQSTKYKNAWRKAHPKVRNKTRKSNYTKTKIIKLSWRRPTGSPHRPWEQWEIEALSEGSPLTDHEISAYLSRSVQAIQQRRYLLKKLRKKT